MCKIEFETKEKKNERWKEEEEEEREKLYKQTNKQTQMTYSNGIRTQLGF